MSDIFENDIDDENLNLSSLEDVADETESEENLIFDRPLYGLKLAYSFETIYGKNEKNLDLKNGDYAIIPTRYGKDMAKVLGEIKKPMGVKVAEIVSIERKATADDLEKAEVNRKKEIDAEKVFKEKVEFHKLDMKLISVHFLQEEQKALFFFSSENRVDFRELVKDLAAVFRTRIELRQIGTRDRSKIVGGIGVCGLPLCCNSFLGEFDGISINMAKNQLLALNPSKINLGTVLSQSIRLFVGIYVVNIISKSSSFLSCNPKSFIQ